MSGSLRELIAAGSREAGTDLSPPAVEQLIILMLELRKWNRKINLTAISADREIIVKHIIDSLTVSPLIPDGARVMDMGSGGGFPSIPLAIARPDLRIVSVDATLKKIHFQRHVIRLLSLNNLDALQARGESLAGSHGGEFEVVLSRAFSSLPDFVSLAQPLITSGGRIIAMKGRGGEDEANNSALFLGQRGLVVKNVKKLFLPFTQDERSLITVGPLY